MGPKPKQTHCEGRRSEGRDSQVPWFVFLGLLFLWFVTGCGLASRLHLIFSYEAIATLPAWLEPITAPFGSIAILFLLASLAIWGWYQQGLEAEPQWQALRSRILVGFTLSAVPLGYSLINQVLNPASAAGIWEMVWYSAWSGLTLSWLFPNKMMLEKSRHERFWIGATATVVAACTLWWYLQASYYFDALRLGFNDAGHFTQRVANTAQGRGFLRETAVLPPFWDHFNPGLAFLVPFWYCFPSPRAFLVLQPIAMAASGCLVGCIARTRGLTIQHACLWTLGWMSIPAIGQMNIAYTYGWHPVVLGIPFLIAGWWFYLQHRIVLGIVSILIACSFEEGIIVAVGCAAAVQIGQQFLHRERALPNTYRPSMTGWFILWFTSVLAFLLVYSWSGFAEFQTARFSTLGRTPWEIVASPILQPEVFWGLLFRTRNFYFLLLLLTPAWIATRGRPSIYWLGMVPGLFVLLIWEHMPAQSLAFQYTATLLPLLILGCIEVQCELESPKGEGNGLRGAADHSFRPLSPFVESGRVPVAFLATSFVMSLFVGQFPWSQETLADVKGRTYHFENEFQRNPGDQDHRWIVEQIDKIRKTPNLRILATGRLAMRFVGVEDVETVGQFWQRRPDLVRFHSELSDPLDAFDYLLLDMHEEFQQSRSESLKAAQDAASRGFIRIGDKFGFEIYQKPSSALPRSVGD